MQKICSTINGSLGKWLTPCVMIAALLVIALFYMWDRSQQQKKKSGFMGGKADFSEYPEVFTMFKVDWCPHCKKAEPEWNQMKKTVEKMDLPVKVVEVDGDERPDEVKKAGVSAFPTMIYRKENNEVKYDGPRDSESLLSFVQQMVSTPVESIRPSAAPVESIPSSAQPQPTLSVPAMSGMPSAAV